MRRRLETFIPIVLFAVLVQLLAPIGAFRAVASTVGDPVAMAQICSGMNASDAGHAAPGQPADCCAFCACAHALTMTMATPPAGFVRLQRSFQQVAWLEAVRAASTARIGSNTQARAPPALS